MQASHQLVQREAIRLGHGAPYCCGVGGSNLNLMVALYPELLHKALAVPYTPPAERVTLWRRRRVGFDNLDPVAVTLDPRNITDG